MACSTANAFDIVCSLDRDGKLDEAPQNKKQHFATSLLRGKLHEQDFAGQTSLRASRALGPISRYRVADILHHMKLVSRASRPGLLVAFFASSVTGYARLKDFTQRNLITRVVLDVRMNPTLSHITMSVPGCTKCLFLFGDRLPCFHGENIFSMTCSPKCSCEASNMESW